MFDFGPPAAAHARGRRILLRDLKTAAGVKKRIVWVLGSSWVFCAFFLIPQPTPGASLSDVTGAALLRCGSCMPVGSIKGILGDLDGDKRNSSRRSRDAIGGLEKFRGAFLYSFEQCESL